MMSQSSNSTIESLKTSLPKDREKCSPSIHIFFNPSSGGNQGKDLLSAQTRSLKIPAGIMDDVTIRMWDIRTGESGKKPGFLRIKEESTNSTCHLPPAIRVIAAGGDGTVMWVISEALLHNLTNADVVFGTIPFGTGNDYSHAFGWGQGIRGRLLTRNLRQLRRLTRQWLAADIVSHDIWRVTIALEPQTGRVLSWKDKELTPLKIDEAGNIFTKLMSNYFSIGVESKVGLDFDKRRTKAKLLNKLVYATQGLKNYGGSNKKIDSVLESCTEDADLLFVTDAGSGSPSLRGHPSSLLFLNINSFAGGLNPWPHATHTGLRPRMKSKTFGDQATGDGKIEVMTYRSLGTIGGEQMRMGALTGHARRVAQSRGPFLLRFKKLPNKGRVYMQVDGEYYAVEHPRSVRIEHMYTVKVMKRVRPREQKR